MEPRRQLIKLVSFGKENKTVLSQRGHLLFQPLYIVNPYRSSVRKICTRYNVDLYYFNSVCIFQQEWTGVEDSFLECLASFQQYIFQQKQNYKARAICRRWWPKIAHIWHFPINKQIFLIPACISLLFILLELLIPHTWVHQSLIKTLSKTSTPLSQDFRSHELS